MFSTYHNLGFNHTHSHTFALHAIFPLIKPLYQLLFSFSYHCQLISIQQFPWQGNPEFFRYGLASTTRSSAIAEGPRDASCQLKSCQLPRNSAETTYTTSPDKIDGMNKQQQRPFKGL